jgi:hypothetical protein
VGAFIETRETMSIKPILNVLAASLALAFTLSGCGGGGGSGAGGGDVATTAATPATTPAATVAALVPGAEMSWATVGERSISLVLQTVDGRPAAGAAVRVFTLSRNSPQDGSALDEPVPVSLLDTVVSDTAGRASLALRSPGHVEELLVVATLQDTQGRTVLTANAADGVVLRLAR